MASRAEEIRTAADLLVGVASLAAAPWAATAGTAVGVAGSLWELYAGRRPKPDLADKVEAALTRELANPAITHVCDAPVLLPQMVPVALPASADLAAAGWDVLAVAGAMRAQVAATATEREHRSPAILGAFERWIAAGLRPLMDDPAFVRETAPEITREMFARFDRLGGKLDDLGARLDAIEGQSRDTLEAMALRFGDPAPEERVLADLKAFLIEKAKDYRALRAEVAAIDDGLKRLSNLKAAAKDAIDRGDLEEVETLLARVQEVELDEAAQSAELRADNALLRGRVDQAFALLSAAADSYAGIDSLEVADRRDTYRGRLYRHGLRYGGPGLALSARMIRAALNSLEMEDDPPLWAKMQNNLAITLRSQGERTAGPAGADLLGAAVAAYRAALRVRTEADHPVDWATTMQNLAIALKTQGARTAGPAGADLLGEAVAAFRAALRVFTEADHPVAWATTMQNLAIALATQGERTAGPAGADLLAEAVAACRAALRVFTEADHPVDWAMTQQNMAVAERARADHDSCTDPRPHLEAALGHVEAALTVFDPEHMPYDHDKATELRDDLRTRLAAL